ncbi:hypothetical protein [Nocardioides sp. CFH 31398]|uniref:hypothetical protein n=1 Tax=Nocardioides sp. CFH 31398 TaxID=2919579 RepID=UPI001F0581AB|nr:hypothetical protein [Nocardioides sp. CFH 31398]MCH1864969.1 hypothetical protein [Nocardioides sp. CFH 31398]
MPSKRDRKQQRKAMVREHERARRREGRTSLLGVLGATALLAAGLVAILVASDVGDGPAPPAWLVVGTAVASFGLVAALVVRRRGAGPGRRRNATLGAVCAAGVGVALLASVVLATSGGGDAASAAAFAATMLVPFALILVVGTLLPEKALAPSGNESATQSTDAALRMLD